MKTNEEYYMEALKKVTDIHIERVKKYGINWTEIGREGTFWMIASKFFRFRDNHQNESVRENVYDSLLDTLSDIVNYCLFYMAMMLKEREKK